MSLLEQAMENCTMIDQITVDDGYGGMDKQWKDGASFRAAIVLNNSMQARAASVEGLTALYTVTTGREINLQFHDVFRRESDGKIFRATSDGDDLRTPKSATLNMRNVSAEEFTLPNG